MHSKHVTFGLPQPKNVTNMFANWLAGLNKKDVKLIRIDSCVLLFGSYGILAMIMSLKNRKLRCFFRLSL
jgi:hypothetical protein